MGKFVDPDLMPPRRVASDFIREYSESIYLDLFQYRPSKNYQSVIESRMQEALLPVIENIVAGAKQ